MPTYTEWNKRLFEYIISGLPRGSHIYLSIDDEALQDIGQGFSTEPINGSWVEDFILAVRFKCVAGNAVMLSRIPIHPRLESNEPPRYLAFLCAMALAAHNMEYDDENEIDENNYLSRLNEILGFSTSRRPLGLKQYEEVTLWDDWSVWLREHGYFPSAQKRGTQYISLPISQALLRNSDKNTLWRYFSAHSGLYRRQLALLQDDLMQRLYIDARSDTQGLTKHLQRLVKSDGQVGSQRYYDIASSVNEIYEEWLASTDQDERTLHTRSVFRETLTAGLYRVENPLSRQVSYHIFPRQPRHAQISNAYAIYDNERERLNEERPGWFAPLWELSQEHLSNGLECSLENAGTFKKLGVPARSFWLLTPDKDNPESGIFATWEGRPELGIPFILLCRADLLQQLQHLKNEGLIDWKRHITPFGENASWVELYGITVLSDAWKGVNIENKSLYQQLYPQQSIGISLQGGIRDTYSSAWLEDYGPDLTVYAFEDQIRITLIQLGDETVYNEFIVKSGEPIHLEGLPSGIYRVEVDSGNGKLNTREIRITTWESLLPAPDIPSPDLSFGENTVIGAWIAREG